jgi:hypothetical protein
MGQTSSSTYLGCKDGSTCSGERVGGWNCCGVGNRAKCPKAYKACNDAAENGIDFSCWYDCSSHGGEKKCAKPGTPEIMTTKSPTPQLTELEVRGLNVQRSGKYLINELVPRLGQTFSVADRKLKDHEHEWTLMDIDLTKSSNGQSKKWKATNNGVFARVHQKYDKKTELSVLNSKEQVMFKITCKRSLVYFWRKSSCAHDKFFITSGHSQHIMFTITKDLIGTDILGTTKEYRVYRGEKKALKSQAVRYYCVETGTSESSISCYNSKNERESRKPPLAGRFARAGFSKNVYVNGGEDTALLLATTIVMDMTR